MKEQRETAKCGAAAHKPRRLPDRKRTWRQFMSLLLAVALCFTTVASVPGLAITARAEG